MIACLLFALALGNVSEITVPAGPGAAEPFLFASGHGLLLSWLEPAGTAGETALRFAVYRGGRWSDPRTIVQRSDLVVNWADFPSVVEDGSGTLFAHWIQASGKDVWASDVRLQISRDRGATWSAPLLLNRDGNKTEHGFVSLAPLPGGGVGAVWLDGRNEMTVRYATIDAAGTIRSDEEVDPRACECCATGLTMVGGRPVIAYRDRSADEVRDIAVVRRTASGWSKPRLIHPDGWKIAGCPVNGPQLDARGNRVAAAWFTAASEHNRAYAVFSEDGGATFGMPIVIDDGSPLGRVDVVLLDGGAAVVTWLEQTAGGAEIRARSVARNGGRSPSRTIAQSSAAHAAGFARAAAIGDDVYVAWTDAKRVRVARLGNASPRRPVTGSR